jgi:hypothetical protein
MATYVHDGSMLYKLAIAQLCDKKELSPATAVSTQHGIQSCWLAKCYIISDDHTQCLTQYVYLVELDIAVLPAAAPPPSQLHSRQKACNCQCYPTCTTAAMAAEELIHACVREAAGILLAAALILLHQCLLCNQDTQAAAASAVAPTITLSNYACTHLKGIILLTSFRDTHSAMYLPQHALQEPAAVCLTSM